MGDSNRIVVRDETREIKAAAATTAQNKTSGGNTNTQDKPPEEVTTALRNFIQVPDNCPPGYRMCPDGVCREVFD